MFQKTLTDDEISSRHINSRYYSSCLILGILYFKLSYSNYDRVPVLCSVFLKATGN